MNPTRLVAFEKFYGDEEGESRSGILQELKEWSQNLADANHTGHLPHKLVSGTHKIGKKYTIDYALKNSNLCFNIDENTNTDSMLEFMIKIKNYIFEQDPTFRDIAQKHIEEEIKRLENQKTVIGFNEFLIAFLKQIEKLSEIDPNLSIIIKCMSPKNLKSECFESLLESKTRFLFKAIALKEVIGDSDSLILQKCVTDIDNLQLKQLNIAEAKKMISGTHKDFQKKESGLTETFVRNKFHSPHPPDIHSEIIKLVGCHPYLLRLICKRITRFLLANPKTDYNGFLDSIVFCDRDNYNTFYENYLQQIEAFAPEVFAAFQNFARSNELPDIPIQNIMGDYGMIFKLNGECQIPKLLKNFSLNGSVYSAKNSNTIKGEENMNHTEKVLGLKILLKTLNHIPGLKIVSGTIEEFVNKRESEKEKEELLTSISNTVNNSNGLIKEDLNSIRTELEFIRSIIYIIPNLNSTKPRNDTSISAKIGEIAKADELLSKVEFFFQQKTKGQFLSKFNDQKKAYEFFTDFKEIISADSEGALLENVSISDSDGHGDIFRKIFAPYKTLRPYSRKIKFMEYFSKVSEFQIATEWCNFLTNFQSAQNNTITLSRAYLKD